MFKTSRWKNKDFKKYLMILFLKSSKFFFWGGGVGRSFLKKRFIKQNCIVTKNPPLGANCFSLKMKTYNPGLVRGELQLQASTKWAIKMPSC